MQLQTASRKQAKIKLAIQGPASSGKTYSALLLAYGLCGNWEKIGVIDTENNSAALYDHLVEAPIKLTTSGRSKLTTIFAGEDLYVQVC